ncbi:MAG TPA: hypothetical protein VF092_07655 [Longimicrobium sp.]
MNTTAALLVKRTSAHRLTALLALVLFLFSWTGEALGMHGCPHHDAVPSAAQASHAAAHGGHHGAAQPSHDAQAPEHGDQHACTCQGTCPSATGGALPTVADAAVRVAPEFVSKAPRQASGAITPRLVPFFLPYGQGPPPLG